MKKYVFIGLVVLAGFVTIGASSSQYFEISKNLEIFATLYKEVNSYYVDDVDPNEFMQTGIRAMLKSLDPYTNFYSESQMENFRFETTGKYGGIGAIIRTTKDYVVVSEPYEGYAADKAGLIAGDKIVSVDGVSMEGKKSDDVSKLLKGEPGTSLEIKIKRMQADGSEKEMDVTVKREEVKVKNVPYYGMVTDDIGYINLSNFTQQAGKEVQDAYKALKADNENLKGVVLDVRGNPGGLLNESVNIVNTFVKKGQLVVETKGKVEEWDREFKTLNEPLDLDIPLVVLTSRSSASASEIVSGAIQDLDRGVVIGQKTFGKGLVQTTRSLTYNTQLKVTTAKYYIPSGRCIQAIDYAERDEDGAVSKMPDSLKVAFQTLNGRVVYDGGGVDPDILVETDKLSDISISLLRKNLIFEYATYFKANNASIASSRDFELSDSQYNQFVTWLQDKDYDYITESEEMLDQFKEIAEEEEYFDAIATTYDELKDQISHDKKKDLTKQQSEIMELLQSEIVKRYYYKDGAIENRFASDKELIEAITVLNNPSKYNELLAN